MRTAIAVSLGLLLSNAFTPLGWSQVKSSVVINSLTKKKLANGLYLLETKGTFTLGTNDVFYGVKMGYTDSQGQEHFPVVTDFTEPKPGQTTSFAFELQTNILGKWTTTAALYFFDPNFTASVVSQSKSIKLP